MKKRKKWNLELIKIEALKYKKRVDFAKGAPGAYSSAFDNKWLDVVCSHMPKNSVKKWNIELALETCKTLKSKIELKNKSGLYKFLDRNNLMEEATKHFNKNRINNGRCVYLIKFKDDSIYIGLTHDFELRISRHKSYGLLKELSDNEYKCERISDYLNPEEAAKLEQDTISKYSIKVINKKRGGDFGTISRKWTKENVSALAKKYKYRIDFSRDYPSAYAIALRQGYWEEISKHMPIRSTPRYGKRRINTFTV